MQIKLRRYVEKTLDLGDQLFKGKKEKELFLEDLRKQGWEIVKITGEKDGHN